MCFVVHGIILKMPTCFILVFPPTIFSTRQTGPGAADPTPGPGSVPPLPTPPLTPDSKDPPSAAPGLKRLVVFGGNGFVGTRVLQAALAMPDVEIVSVSRRGRPKGLGAGTWADQVQWAEGDALDTERPWRSLLEGDDVGVVSTLGAFGSTEKMYRTCGVANMELIRAAKEAGVRRFAFISVHDFRFPSAHE